MILAIASGKGGTGKTTVAVNLFTALQPTHSVRFIDCDVEEPNAFLFLNPEIDSTRDVTIPVPEIAEERCTYCGLCAEVCQFNALAVIKDSVLVFSEMCHGCGACSLLCPEKAITEKPRPVGQIEEGRSGTSPFIMGRLNTGEALAVPVIKAARQSRAGLDKDTLTIIDAPPGTSCPVINSVKGSDYVLLVTEPTPFGLNDLDLAAQTMAELDIPCGVLINRSGEEDGIIIDYCKNNDLALVGSIPYSRRMAQSYAKGRLVVQEDPRIKSQLLKIFDTIQSQIHERTRRY